MQLSFKKTFFVRRLRFLIDLMLPPRCMICRNEDVSRTYSVCGDCFQKITWIAAGACKKCGAPKPVGDSDDDFELCVNCPPERYFDQAKSCVVYDEFSKKIVIHFKNFDQTEYARLISEIMIQKYFEFIKNHHLIMPVPLSRKRLFIRKFNQAGLIANHIAKRMDIHVNHRLLYRIKNTQKQSGDYKARFDNLQDAFACREYSFAGKKILIIDDVLTSGATINQIASMLKEKGCESISLLTFARAVKR